MPHLVLLGDSIFDNAAYTQGNPDVISQLRLKLPNNWNATLKAIDGHRIDNVYSQLENLPTDTSHIFISVGGNDALSCRGILDQPVASSIEVFSNLADLSKQFEQQYQRLLQKVLSLGFATTICTIYNPNFPDKMYQKVAVAALTIFNDVITRQAFQASIPLIDLRLTCNEAQDYANPIEPSTVGGEKIANVIMNRPLAELRKIS